MAASRIRVMGAYYPGRFWLSACCAALMPTSIGYQDLAALIARQPGMSAQWREHMIASPFGTIEAATFSYTRPTGTAMPEPLGFFQTVNFDPRSLDAYAWKIDEPITARPARQIEYPSVNRDRKGDRQPAIAPAAADPASLPQLQRINAPDAPAAAPAQPAAPVIAPPANQAQQHAEEPAAAPPVAQMDAPSDAAVAYAPTAPGVGAAADVIRQAALAPPAGDVIRGGSADNNALADKPPEIPPPGENDANEATSPLNELSFLDDDAGDRSAQVYFGGGVMGSPARLQSWAPGEEPLVAPSPAELAALEPTDGDAGAGATVTGKDNARLESPAEHLGLTGKPRAEAEKCLADAVYFEARGEVLKGQQAVAQVVMNRVFSGYYPHDVCGVVYQNANRHLACQFTFACEGKDLSRIDEPDMWEQAKQIAKDTLDGKIWLAEVGHATHYHAYWVHPSWVHEMAKLYHLGVHTFYRPRNWGDGDDEPVWGAAPNTSKANTPADKPEAAATSPEVPTQNADAANKSPQAAASPTAPVAAKIDPTKTEPTAKL